MNMERNIMIVEDDEELHTLYGLYLQGENYHILRAFNGKQALEILSNAKPDLIILDMIMPEMDGEAFLEEFHNRSGINKIPIIIASVNDNIPKKYLDMARIHAVLRKPFSIDTLVTKIKEAIN